MKTIFNRFITAAAALYLIIILSILVLLSSCSSGRWYGKSHDGCQQSSGFAGYGNRK